ncbi:MAG: YdeI/OmpD-associated family protein [Chloroflexi bacterium]|nr:YdeI/OmpD-associated family protein [Chloroflexota bacterium]
METKLGQTVPQDLALALQQSADMLTTWDKLRPSCQRTYVKYLDEAKKPETRARRVQRVLKMTADYYRRHQKERQEPNTIVRKRQE